MSKLGGTVVLEYMYVPTCIRVRFRKNTSCQAETCSQTLELESRKYYLAMKLVTKF